MPQSMQQVPILAPSFRSSKPPAKKKKKTRKRQTKESGCTTITYGRATTFCHVFSSKDGATSQRTRAAAGAHVSKSSSQLLPRITVRNRKRSAGRKRKKLASKLDTIHVTEEMERAAAQFPTSYLEDNVVVFDGGEVSATAIPPVDPIQGWTPVSVLPGPLVICEPSCAEKGLMYVGTNTRNPSFVLLPRSDAIGINSDGREVCHSMTKITRKQTNLVRGSSKTVYGRNKYCCVGAKPKRNAPGIHPGIFRYEQKVNVSDWDCVVKAVKRCEHAFYGFLDTEVISHIQEARKLIPWESISYSGSNEGSNATIYNGIAFGVNVFLRAHIDQDFTYSVIQVHVDGVDYSLDDAIMCYFCFPCLGVAVPLRPGDFLLVNALEYHCLSSRCNSDVDIFCVSSYLKTAVVGGNDNGKLLNEDEIKCLSLYPKKRSKNRIIC